MKRLFGILLTIGFGVLLMLAGAGARAQSNGGQTAETSKEWPTYGHDSGGMRFSPLTEITPANVGELKVAWVYHMRPAGFVATDFGRGGRGQVPAGVPVGDAPEAPPAARGRGGRGGSGFRPSEATPLVINGTMYVSTPYS